ncbi:NADPH:quinone reductase [Pseudonocardia lutea]|uniref:NADPH:quinone reductase n=1 Tax=Pseudonocardia lutea TaxID=2172015 RepID=A0ABW1I7I6_9PSEU
MRAAFYDRTGPAREVLRVGEVDTPGPGPGQVRVRVRLSAVNPTDVKTRDGTTARPFDGVRIPHQDGVGEIDAVGDGVDPGRVGQRVWLWLASPGGPGGAPLAEWGTAAECCVVPQEQAVPLPESASDELGACLGVPAMTAYHCLFAGGSPHGTNVLVAGGAGAVGHFAVEIGGWAGATVVTTVSGPEKAELAKQAGADLVVNYREPDAEQQIRALVPQVDRVVEVALGANLDLDLALLANGGTVVTYAAAPQDPTIPVRRLMTANAALRFVLLYGVPRAELAAAARELTVAVAEGALSPLPVHRFALDDIAAAHEAVESGTTGKVLVDIG